MATTVQKLVVEVIDARNLVPKDGHGTSNPYVVIDYYGQRKRTKTVSKDINPAWNEVLQFNVEKTSDVFSDMLELDVYHDKNHGPTSRNNSLGRIKLSSGQFVKKGEEALIYYPLERKYVLSWVRGEIGLKIYYVDEVVPRPPVAPLPPVEETKAEEVKAETQADTAAAPVSSDQQQAPAEVKPDDTAVSKSEGDQAAEAPPADGEKATEAEPGGEENGAAEGGEPEEGADQVEPEADSKSVQLDQHDDDIVLEPASANWAPSKQPEMMASTASGSIPEESIIYIYKRRNGIL